MNKKLLDPLIHFLQIPSISMEDEYKPQMREARHFLIDLLGSLNFKTKIIKGRKHDLVFAQRIENKSLPTILVYGHYDVQPADPLGEWKTKPFEPSIKNGRLYARGATDNKGQLMVHVMAIKKLLDKNKKLSANFKFLIEGEEELGSISIESVVNKHKNLLKAYYIVVSDSEMPAKNNPAIDISLRGLLYTEVEVQSAKQDLHSGQFGGVAENPAIVLSNIISELKDKSGKILIPGFYEDVLPLSTQEKKDYKKAKITKNQLLKESGTYALAGGENNYSINERRWSRPTLDVNGFTSGYSGPGSKTIIPAKASAKISMRLVPNQDADVIYKQFTAYIKSIAPKSVKVSISKHASSLPYKAPTNHPIFDLAKASLKETFGRAAVFQGVGGSIGFVPVMAKALNVPCIMIGFGLPTDNLHSPNESIDLDNYYQGQKAMVNFYTKIGKHE